MASDVGWLEGVKGVGAHCSNKYTVTLGKHANFVILDQNPLKVDPMELKDIKIERTVYNGCDF